jgi:hypothetical protein
MNGVMASNGLRFQSALLPLAGGAKLPAVEAGTFPGSGQSSPISTQTEELIRICEALPEDKQTEVADFAKFLLDRQGDGRWRTVRVNRRTGVTKTMRVLPLRP